MNANLDFEIIFVGSVVTLLRNSGVALLYVVGSSIIVWVV